MKINEFTSLENTIHLYLEFLLDEKLLRKELTINSDNSKAAFLISTFLHQVESTKEINNLQNPSDENKANIDGENDRTRSLRLLAMKVASFVSWDLDYLSQNIPVNYVYTLLTDLMKWTCPGDTSEIPNPNLEVHLMSPEAVFAVNLFCCWSLKFIAEANKPMKPIKAAQIQLPVFNPCIQPPSAKDAMFQILQKKERECICLLEKVVMSRPKIIAMPTMKCFSFSNKNGRGACDWSLCKDINPTEILKLATYVLGCWYFFRRDFQSALGAMEYCKDQLGEVENPVFLKIDSTRLDGYLKTCRGIVNAPSSTKASLYEQANTAIKSNDIKLLSFVLTEDLEKQTFNLCFRYELEKKSVADKEMHMDVIVYNALRKIMNGGVIVPKLVENIRKGNIPLNDFMKTFSDICFNVPLNQQNNLKQFLLHLRMVLPKSSGVKDFLSTEPLKRLFDEKDLILYESKVDDDILECNLISLESFADSDRNIIVNTNLEQQLLTSYGVSDTVELVNSLVRMADRNNLMYLSDTWKISELNPALNSIPFEFGHLPLLVNTLISKAKTCRKLEMFDESKELLNCAVSMTMQTNLNGVKEFLNREIIDTELMRNIVLKKTCKEASEMAKNCLKLLVRNASMKSTKNEYLSSIIYLLNNEQWSVLLELKNEGSRLCEFENLGILLGGLGRDRSPTKNSKKLARRFIELITPTFLTSNSQNHSIPIEPFLRFVSLIHNEKPLLVVVSSLVKLLKCSTEKSTYDISCDYEDFWPNVLNVKAQNLSRNKIREALQNVLNHALKSNISNGSFTRALADLYHEFKSYDSSVRCYMYSGVLETSYFCDDVSAFDDETLKKIVQAFVDMKFFSRAATTCQFTKEVDYEMAAKCIYERRSLDTFDNYYECIFDSSVLELLIKSHAANGEDQKLRRAKQLMTSPELNNYRSAQTLTEFTRLKRRKFFRKIANAYLTHPTRSFKKSSRPC